MGFSSRPEPPPQLGREAEQTAAREQHDEHQHRAEDQLPVLGEAGQPLLEQQEGRARR